MARRGLGGAIKSPESFQPQQKLFEARWQEFGSAMPKYHSCLPGEADWRAARRAQEQRTADLAAAAAGGIIFAGMTRVELYEAVRAEPTQTVAKRHGLSDNGLRKICRKYKIPLPSRGYWANKRSTRSTKKFRRKALFRINRTA